ncbi:MAG: glycosyltransferase family 4 protein [Chloroflexi bacterium]|nr:glycosyltransferase family 4 protein [Chloroflexota bacterium]
MNLLVVTYKVDQADSLVGFAVGWLNALAARLDHLDVICLARGPAQLRENITVHSLGKERGARKLAQAIEFYRVALRARADVVFCQFSPIFVVAIAPIAKLRGWPTVLWYTHRHVDLKLRIATALADRVVTASPESFGLASSKVRVIGHGIDTERFAPDESGLADPTRLKTILAVGRIAPIKNYEMLIEAASRITRQRADAEFVVAGGVQAKGLEDYFDGLKAMAVERGLGDRFRFIGSVPHGEVPELYRRATVSVNLCPTGGMDKAVLEGLAAGVPVVVCNRSFAPLLGDERLLVPEGDAAALAERLNTMLDTPESQRKEWGNRLRERVQAEHGLERFAIRIIDVVKEVAGRPGSGYVAD